MTSKQIRRITEDILQRLERAMEDMERIGDGGIAEDRDMLLLSIDEVLGLIESLPRKAKSGRLEFAVEQIEAVRERLLRV